MTTPTQLATDFHDGQTTFEVGLLANRAWTRRDGLWHRWFTDWDANSAPADDLTADDDWIARQIAHGRHRLDPAARAFEVKVHYADDVVTRDNRISDGADGEDPRPLTAWEVRPGRPRCRGDRGGDPMSTAIKVTVTDPESGEVLGEKVIENDYLLLVAGDRYLDGVQAHANGTHVLTVKRKVEVSR